MYSLPHARERVADRPGEGDGIRIREFLAMTILLNHALVLTYSRAVGVAVKQLAVHHV